MKIVVATSHANILSVMSIIRITNPTDVSRIALTAPGYVGETPKRPSPWTAILYQAFDYPGLILIFPPESFLRYDVMSIITVGKRRADLTASNIRAYWII